MKANATFSREQFNTELENCLTIISEVSKNAKYTFYECDYITPALYHKIVIVAVYE